MIIKDLGYELEQDLIKVDCNGIPDIVSKQISIEKQKIVNQMTKDLNVLYECSKIRESKFAIPETTKILLNIGQ